MANTYKIPVVYECAGIMLVQADSLEEAIDKAIHEEKLPSEASYIEDSLVVDKENPSFGDVELKCNSCGNVFWKSDLDKTRKCPLCGSDE